jgi:hypothetical protein
MGRDPIDHLSFARRKNCFEANGCDFHTEMIFVVVIISNMNLSATKIVIFVICFSFWTLNCDNGN